MQFHEDVIFKNEGDIYGSELLELLNIKGKIIKVHKTEYSVIDPKNVQAGHCIRTGGQNCNC